MLDTSPKLRASYSWASVVKATTILRDGFHFRVGESNLSIWFDKWSSHSTLAQFVDYVHVSDMNLNLKVILHNGVAWSKKHYFMYLEIAPKLLEFGRLSTSSLSLLILRTMHQFGCSTMLLALVESCSLSLHGSFGRLGIWRFSNTTSGIIGHCLESFVGYCDNTTNLNVELLTIYHGICIAKHLGFTSVICKSNSMVGIIKKGVPIARIRAYFDST
ncbi:hypothetical protein JHK82_031456 [Glycine max]|nr:hypothetical protein JHK85_032115 [Glycine max]KAG5124719.1 hypothetical protein JHK82_031456 [Glycine max]